MGRNRFGIEDPDAVSDEVSVKEIIPAAKTPDEKPWYEWVEELGANRAIARGACADASADWDAPVSKSVFESAVKKFGGKGHGR